MTQPAAWERDRRMRRALESPRAQMLAPQMRLFAQAVWHPAGKRRAHVQCRAALPRYVAAEMAGDLTAWRGSFVQAHLQTCRRCATAYAALLETLLRDARGAWQQNDLPSPDLSFLELPHD